MIDFTGARIHKLIIHGVGNKLREDGIVLSQECVQMSEDSLHNLLGKFFFQRFKENTLYKFHHKTSLEFNEIYQYVKSIFFDLTSFEVNSNLIAQHLYEVSTHPNIRSGELYVAYITDAMLNEFKYDAIGIFKSENKDAFLKIVDEGQNFTVKWDQGININKLDKGCIIFNNHAEMGYSILPVDSGSGIDTKYWREDFLGIQVKENSSIKTKFLVEACKEFVKADIKSDKKDKVVMLNNVIEYMRANPRVNLDDFTNHVTGRTDRSIELKNFISSYASKREIADVENFPIDYSTFKNIKKRIKNFIKLDNNFEIKINRSSGYNHEYIEKGYDDQKKMYFYKIYFNEEE